MTQSVFAGAFDETTLTYTVESEGHVDPDTELWVEGEPVTKTVKAIIATPRSPNIQTQIGADSIRVDYEGALSTPREPPSDFFTGVEVSFTVDGRTVKGVVRVFMPSAIPALGVLGRPIQIAGVG